MIINIPFNAEQIAEQMSTHYNSLFPDIKTRGSFIDIFWNYVDVTVKQSLVGIWMGTDLQIESNQIPLDLVKLRNQCGRYGKPQQYWFDWFRQHAPLFHEQTKGNNITGQRTMVKLAMDIDLDILLADTNPKDLFEAIYESVLDDLLDPNIIDWVPIDRRSLKAYLDDNQSKQQLSKGYKLRKLKENYKIALVIYKITEITDRLHKQDPSFPIGLPQIINESKFGRKYYRGPNLQSSPKEVRIAALGRSHQYDIGNSVFAWKIGLIREIAPELSTSYTLDYLDYKDAIRKKLANNIFVDKNFTIESRIKYVKQILTAIGFGASGQTGQSWKNENGTWQSTALNDIITSREELTKFLNDPWMKAFLDEQIKINAKIFEWAKANYDLEEESLRSKTNQLSKNKVLAYLYQRSERTIIEQCIDIAGRENVLLLCHDAIYTRYPAKIIDLKIKLQEFSRYTTIEHQAIQPWAFDDTTDHYNRIKEQELFALEYSKKLGVDITKSVKDIEQKYDWNLNQHSLRMKENYFNEDGRDFDRGYRADSNYDPDLDPFYD